MNTLRCGFRQHPFERETLTWTFGHALTRPLPTPLVVLLGAFLVLLPGAAGAQEASESGASPRAAWASVGLGPGSMGSAGGASLSMRSGGHILAARWVGGGPFDPMGPGTGKDLGEVSALYGRGSAGPRSWRSVGVGLGMMYGTEYRLAHDWIPEERKIGPTIGLALEAQLNWQPTRWTGLGLLGFGNVNADSPFGGLLLAVQVGKLR